MENLHNFNIKTGAKQRNYTHVVIDNNFKVVHRYDKVIFDKNGKYTQGYVDFLNSIDFSISKVQQVSEIVDSLLHAKFRVHIQVELNKLGTDSKFSKLFS